MQKPPFHIRFVQTIQNSPHQEYLSYLFVFISSIFWALIWVYPSQHNINPVQTNLIRGLIVTVGTYVICWKFDYDLDFKNAHSLKWLNIRNGLVSVHSIVLAFVQFILPLPLVYTISSSGNLFVFLLDYKLYGIKINASQAAGLVIGFIGILGVVMGRPITYWLSPQTEFTSEFKNYITTDPMTIGTVATLFVFETVIWSYSVVIIKNIKGMNSSQINYHQGFTVILVSGFFYPFFENKATLEDLLSCLFVNIVPVMIGQMFFIAALTMSKNLGILTMITFMTVVVAYLLSIFRYHETQNTICTFGVLLVVLGLWKALFSKK